MNCFKYVVDNGQSRTPVPTIICSPVGAIIDRPQSPTHKRWRKQCANPKSLPPRGRWIAKQDGEGKSYRIFITLSPAKAGAPPKGEPRFVLCNYCTYNNHLIGSHLKGSSQQNFLWKFAYYEIVAKPNILIITDFIQLSPTAYGGAPLQSWAFLFPSPAMHLYQGNGG